jgi:hypothetical protein
MDTCAYQPNWAYVSMTKMDAEQSSEDDFEFPSYVADSGRRYRAIARCEWEKGFYSKIIHFWITKKVGFTWGMVDDYPPMLTVVKPVHDLGISVVGLFSDYDKNLTNAWTEVYGTFWQKSLLPIPFLTDKIANHKFDLRDTISANGRTGDFVFFYSQAPSPRDALPKLAKDLNLAGPETFGFPYPWPKGYTTLGLASAPRQPMNKVKFEGFLNNAVETITKEHKGLGELLSPP